MKTRYTPSPVVFLASFITASTAVMGQPGNLLVNGDLKTGDYHGWVLDPALARAGRVEVDGGTNPSSLRLQPNSYNTAKEKPFGIGQMLPASGLLSKTLIVRGAIKTRGAAGIILAFALDARGKAVAQATLQQFDRSKDFRPQHGLLVVPADAASIIFAVVTPSVSGTVWFSDVYIGGEEANGVQ